MRLVQRFIFYFENHQFIDDLHVQIRNNIGTVSKFEVY